ncbi:MAG: type IX secretion system membrane protein PorP/SprF, partial [Flavobacteriales bacterium]
MKNFLYVICIVCLTCLTEMAVNAQDIHFSLFNNCTQLINPALTGQFETMMRGTILHRRQWRN